MHCDQYCPQIQLRYMRYLSVSSRCPQKIAVICLICDIGAVFLTYFGESIYGWEVVNAYSELIDPEEQRERLNHQMEARRAGDQQAMEMDEDFILCMEHGMPPMSGWGMGVDRVVALLTDSETLRDVVLFPLMRPDK